MTLRSRLALALVLGAVALTGCGRYGTSHAAVVEGRTISFDELDDEVARQSKTDEVRARLSSGGEAARNEFRRQVLLQLVRRELIFAEIARRRIVISDAEVEKRFQQHVRRAGSAELLARQFAQQGLTERKFRERIRQDAQLERLQKKVAPVTVTEEEVRAEYASRRAQLEQVHIRHILFAVPDQSAVRKVALRAEETLKALRGGADFAALARERSEDAASASRGGDLGFLSIGALGEQVGPVVGRLRVGEVSHLVPSAVGIHILQLLERRPVTFGQVRDTLRQEIGVRKADAGLQEHVRKLLTGSAVEINPRLGDFDPRLPAIVEHEFFTRVTGEQTEEVPLLPGATPPR